MKTWGRQFDPRQVMHRQDFEVFHYQDAKPGRVEMHHHDFYEVYFFLGGEVEYRVEGRVYRLAPGDLLLINPMELHQPIVEPGTPYERIVLWIDRGYLEGFSRGDVSLTRCFDNALPTHTNLLRPTPVQRTEISTRLKALVRENDSSDYASDLCAAGIFLQFMADLNRMALHTQVSPESRGNSDSLISQVLDYIGEHYHEELSLEILAQQFYVSKYYLSHEFSRLVGTGVYRYIMLKRLLIAKQLLSGGISPGTVCANCGFGDYANFYRAFKSLYGISPRACIGAEQEK